MNRIVTLLLISCCIASFPGQSQNFKDYLSKYTEENGTGYMQPAGDALGANLNTGWFHSAKLKKLKPQVYVGLVGMIAFVPDEKKTFLATPEGLFTPKTPTEASTVFGSGESTTIEGDEGTSYTFPGGLEVKAVPLAAPQVSVGSVFGTDVSLRFIAYKFDQEDVGGKVNLFGFGLRHSISQYLSAMPAQLAVAYYWTTASVGEVMETNASLISLQSSYSVKILTVYGGLGYEMSNTNVVYTFKEDEDVEEDISFNLDGGNKIRFTLGVGLNLGPVRLHTDYNIADQSVFSFGMGLGFGDN